MILRRPYAFLIKHFRLIHLFMFVLMAYMTYKANNMLSFFKDYIEANGIIGVAESSYFSILIFIAGFLVIVLSVTVFFLMRYKKKPRTLYIVIAVISAIAMGLFVYLHGNIRTLETTVMTGRSVRLLRDISRFNFWLLFVMCIPLIVRGLGFDIRKFNFNKDLQELKLDEKDSEEVEVSVDLSGEGVRRTGRKVLRELKYYYAENKLFINIILGVVIIVLFMAFPFNMFVVNRDLGEGETLGTKYFNIKITDSYISERKRISKNNSYVILKIEVMGKTNKYKLDLDEFTLEGKNKKYVPSLKYYYYFTDIGVGYRENVLDTKDYSEYILVYNIDNVDKDSKFSFKYIGSDRKVKLKPSVLK